MSDIPLLKSLNAALAEARRQAEADENSHGMEYEVEQNEGNLLHGVKAKVEDINQNDITKDGVITNGVESHNRTNSEDNAKDTKDVDGLKIENLEINEEDENQNREIKEDPIFKQIQETIRKNQHRRDSVTSSTSSMSAAEEEHSVKTAANFSSVHYGFQPRSSYEHSKKYTDIMGGMFSVFNCYPWYYKQCLVVRE